MKHATVRVSLAEGDAPRRSLSLPPSLGGRLNPEDLALQFREPMFDLRQRRPPNVTDRFVML